MKKGIAIFLTCVIALVTCCSCKQKPLSKKEYDLKEFNFLIPFPTNEYLLTDSATLLLDKFMMEMLKDSCDNQSVIFLHIKNFEEELQKNEFIGVCRAKEIVDYYEEKYKIKRANCFIVDLKPRYLTIPGMPGIQLTYRKKGL